MLNSSKAKPLKGPEGIQPLNQTVIFNHCPPLSLSWPHPLILPTAASTGEGGKVPAGTHGGKATPLSSIIACAARHLFRSH